MEFAKEGHLGGFVKHNEDCPNGDPMTYLPSLWKHMVELHQIKSILDIGSGPGHAVNFFSSLGVEALGIDGCQEAIDTAVAKVKKHDFCLSPYQGKEIDVIWSCEFLEHVEEKYIQNVLCTLNLAKNFVYLTAAGPGQGGYHHVNCQPSIYWIKHMEGNGWIFDQFLTNLAKAFSRLDQDPNWFSINGLVFKRQK